MEQVKFINKECEVEMSRVYSVEEKKVWRAVSRLLIPSERREEPDNFQEYYLINRIDLHAILKQKAVDPEGLGPPVRIQTNTSVIELDCENATMTLEDGTVVEADLVVGADGIHSKTRSCVIGHKVPLFSTGTCCYRTLIPIADLLADPQTKGIVEPEGTFVQISSPDRRICLYPCSGGRLMNLAIFVPRSEVGEIKKGE